MKRANTIALALLTLFFALPAQADRFEFDFTLNDPGLQASLDGAGGASGFVSFDGSVGAGDYLLTTFTNLQMSFTFGTTTFTLADLNDPQNIIELRIRDILGGQEIVQIYDTVGNFTQFFSGPGALAFDSFGGAGSYRNFRLGDAVLFPGQGINLPGRFTATRVPEPGTLALLGLGLAGLGLSRRKKKA